MTNQPLSNCCFAPLIPETDRCSKCKENCQPVEVGRDENT
jgi:hypothetical protein